MDEKDSQPENRFDFLEVFADALGSVIGRAFLLLAVFFLIPVIFTIAAILIGSAGATEIYHPNWTGVFSWPVAFLWSVGLLAFSLAFIFFEWRLRSLLIPLLGLPAVMIAIFFSILLP